MVAMGNQGHKNNPREEPSGLRASGLADGIIEERPCPA